MVSTSQLTAHPRLSAVGWRQTSRQRYVRRRSERKPLYAIITKQLERWLAEHDAHGQPISRHVEAEVRRDFACTLLCFGFARSRCGRCGQGFLVAFSCKARGVGPSCTGRRMAQTAAQMGFLSREAATDMLAWQHSGFSIDAGVPIAPSDRDVPAYFQSLDRDI